MRKLNAFCVALLSVFFFFGCLPSLHPLYTEDTLVFDEQLVGKWYGEGEIWSFVHAGGKKYGLSVLDDDGKQAAFEVHLVQLGEHRFIDLYPGKNMDLENTAGMYSFNLMPAHTFMKIELSDPNLKLQWVYLGELIEDDPNLLKHELIPENSKGNDTFEDDTILITAQSEDIQRVILQNMEKVFTEHAGGEFRRCPSVFSENDIIFEQRLMGQWQSKKNQYLDIIEWETGTYDIMISDEPDKCREFKAVLYLLDNWRLLGLYSNPPSKAEEEAGLHLIPDAFLLVEQIEPELILHRIDWETMHEFLHGDYALGGDSLPEPDYVLQKSGL